MSILPLPTPDQRRLVLRPIHPQDAPALAAAFERLSPQSRHRRFLGVKTVLTARELVQLTDVDHRTHEAVVAVDDQERILGVARYAAEPDRPGTADVAFVVADAEQGRGLGTLLAAKLIERARDNGVRRLEAGTFWDNAPALALLRGLGFRARGSSGGIVQLVLELAYR